MKSKVGSFLFHTCVSVGILSSPIVVAQDMTQIVGGSNVSSITEYPYQTFLEVSWGWACGGSLIADNWVLTAAHCVKDGSTIPTSALTIYAGFTNLSSPGTKLQYRSVAEIIVHPGYNASTADNDVALVRLSTPFNLTTAGDHIKPIELISNFGVSSGWFDHGTMCTITGWGTLTSGGDGPDILQKAQVPVVNKTTSGINYPSTWITDNMVLAGYVAGGIDACQGDSGGPLAFRNPVTNNWTLGGVTSWGFGCADPGYPGVYARVSRYLTWIETTSGIKPPSDPVAGLDATSLNNHVIAYPNPTQGRIFVEFSGLFSETFDAKISLFNLNGQVLMQKAQIVQPEEVLQVDVPNHLGAGVYMLEIQTPSGTVQKRMIVQ